MSPQFCKKKKEKKKKKVAIEIIVKYLSLCQKIQSLENPYIYLFIVEFSKNILIFTAQMDFEK